MSGKLIYTEFLGSKTAASL